MNTQIEKAKRQLREIATMLAEMESIGAEEKSASVNDQPIRCIAKYGQLYDMATQKRIVFIENSICELSCTNFKYPAEEEISCKTVDELAKEVTAKNGGYRKIFDRGKVLYFYLMQPQNEEKDKELKKEHRRYTFKCVLLEDLYVKQTEKKNGHGYKFYECHCKTVESNAAYFESTSGKSLAELFRKTSILYNEDYTSANALVTDYYHVDKYFGDNNKLKSACDRLFEN